MSEPTPADEASLELVGLRRRSGSVTALDGLTFGVPPGAAVGSSLAHGAAPGIVITGRGVPAARLRVLRHGVRLPRSQSAV